MAEKYWFLYSTSDGTITECQRRDCPDEWTTLSEGIDVLGYTLDDPTGKDCYLTGARGYVVQNNNLVCTLTDIDRLNDAKSKKNLELLASYQDCLNRGFQITIGAGSYTLGWGSNDRINLQLTNTSIEKGDQVFPIYYTDINGNPFQLTQQSDLDSIETIATKFYVAQHQQVQSLKYQVSQATLDTIDSITWIDAEY